MMRYMRKYISLVYVIASLLILSCSTSDEPLKDNNPPADISFSNPREVNIVGYAGNAMEPFISRDGSKLFFNNLNSSTLPGGAENDTNIHYAERIDDVTFQYKGEVIGADTDIISGTGPGANELEAVASMDRDNKFYFISTIEYLDNTSPNYLLSIYRADFSNGTLSIIESNPNLKNDRPPGQPPIIGELNFDAEINYDGDLLYFVEGIFSGNPLPDEADIGVAVNVNGVFTVKVGSSDEFASVNTDALEYAPSISTDGLELYFTRASGSVGTGFDFGIYIATRSSVSEAWDNINVLDSISGDITEGPSISLDGSLLYYHQKVSDVYRVYVVERE